LQGTIDELQDY